MTHTPHDALFKVGPADRAIVEAADLETLERYAERVLTAKSLARVLAS